jgi:hypothetical protein
MTRYTKIAFTLLFAAALMTATAVEPWMHSTQATATQPIQIAQNSDQVVVKKIVQQQLGKSKQFKVRKVAVVSGYALVSWIEGEAGGQALLQKQSGTWKILTYGGGWLGLGGLKQAGVPQAIAERLLTQIDGCN